ncbi:MAG: hypothetical protein IH987_22575 [Planctomycetes bacterium]|nr:hypothetical protein [Planctomycetota bacterium]
MCRPYVRKLYDDAHKQSLIETIESAPDSLCRVLTGLTDAQIELRYRNWTIRQIVHHIANSHMQA